MEDISKNISLEILNLDSWTQFISNNCWLDKDNFREICLRYGFPNNSLTVVIENYYIDAAYRDVYYHYWSRSHFNWPRYCKRIFLFQNSHSQEEFFDSECRDGLNNDFLGTLVVRPAYSSETDHTFGRTLLNPYKMFIIDGESQKVYPFVYLKTAEYKVHLLGNTYVTRAFPFSSQDGVAMKCAETAIYELCDYASASSALFAKVLPSDIQNKLRERLPERILPSHGLYCNDISYLLRKFGFSPMIYAGTGDSERAGSEQEHVEIQDLRIGLISTNILSEEQIASDEQTWDNQHTTDFKDWFHYYVESAIPVLTITAPNQEVNKHAALVIGHGISRKSMDDCRIYHLGNLPCIDTAELYDEYIIQDDNQIPYSQEKMDRFTQLKNYKLAAYIVPLERHVFLEASSAISICDTVITEEGEMINEAVQYIIGEYSICADKASDSELKSQYLSLIDAMAVSEDNPITVRYYLVNSAEYKQFRISNGDVRSDKKFYADVPMPKSVWIAEISTYKFYEMGYAFAEVVLDATASNLSKVNSVILLRTAHFGVYRLPSEAYNDFKAKIEKNKQYMDLSPVFAMFSNFICDED